MNVWVMNVGQVGKILRAELSDAEGPVDLSQYDTVKVRVKASAGSSTILVNQLCVIDADQATVADPTDLLLEGKGRLTFTTEATAAALSARTYVMNFECLDGVTPTYFPLNRRLEQTFHKFVVQPV